MTGAPELRFDPKELIPALFFLAIGTFFFVNAVFFVGLDEAASGSGVLAAIVSVLLIGIGLILAVRALLRGGERLTFLSVPKLLVILGSPILFALTVRPLGFIPSLILSLICGNLADTTMPLRRRLVVILAITALCVVVFHYGLQLPFPLVAGMNLP
jgi:hypothetical protein